MLTESYCSRDDPPELLAPIDKIKSFPHRIEHVIQWARESLVEAILYMQPLPEPDRPKTYFDCIAWVSENFIETSLINHSLMIEGT